MANVMFDEKTLYYQYMINNNPTSTMLNSISGNYGNDGFGAMGSLGTLGSLGGVSSFSSILENYLTGMKLNSYADSIQASTMADKLSSVLEEAGKTEDTSSLTYQTVQELYEYFSEQVSTKASALLGSTLNYSGSTESDSSASKTVSTNQAVDQMNQAAMKGLEYDFAEIDDIVDSAFAEQAPWA